MSSTMCSAASGSPPHEDELRTLTATGATQHHPPHPHRHQRRARPARRPPRRHGRLLTLLAGYHDDDLGTLSRVPLLHLTVTVVGLPLTAAAVGWLLAGREPPALARQPLA